MTGYNPDIRYNTNWREEGLVCGYEHCIECMPLAHDEEGNDLAPELCCPVFGHVCPGGIDAVRICKCT